MALRIAEVGREGLAEYSRVPIAFEVQSVLEVERARGGLGGLALTEVAVTRPYSKDYDASPQGGPQRWPEGFDLKNWGIFIGYHEGSPVCGATVAHDTPGVHMLGGRRDLAVLWDIRVLPGLRRSGVGTEIFTHAADWARRRGAVQLKIETQNINVPACRFYSGRGCELGEINLHAYAGDPEAADEVMLVWYLDLRQAR
jgi:GNAT superfamily N-acetyltransferase